ncbi:MAG TPA: sugar phosphate isomerase/epimerase [Myxococcota bacterium]|nr:sugar phosphate isomerase/epimerase [Myxococcota bacterium]
MTTRYGLQLYTLREDCARDLDGTLAFVARCGFPAVEAALLPGLTARGLRSALDRAGLAVCSAHALPFGDGAERALDDAQALGAPLVVVPFAHPERFASASAVAALAEELKAAAALAQSRGLRLGYHNHFWEWSALEDGSAAFDGLVAHLDPAVELELDIYWAKTAGRDPAAEIARHGARVTRLHLKDGPADKPESPMTALGDGVVDLKRAIAAATCADWMLVELDHCATSMRESVRKSAEWLGLPAR